MITLFRSGKAKLIVFLLFVPAMMAKLLTGICKWGQCRHALDIRHNLSQKTDLSSVES